MKCLILAFAIVVCVSAPLVAKETKVIVASDPPGAMIYATGSDGIERPYGYTPVAIRVRLADTKDGCREMRQLRAHWVSGAEATLPTLQVCKKTPGKDPVMFMRPTGMPGLEADARFGLDMARQAHDRQQAALQAYLAALSRTPPPPPPLVPYVMQPLTPAAVPTEVRCTSTLVGTYVYTTCR